MELVYILGFIVFLLMATVIADFFSSTPSMGVCDCHAYPCKHSNFVEDGE